MDPGSWHNHVLLQATLPLAESGPCSLCSHSGDLAYLGRQLDPGQLSVFNSSLNFTNKPTSASLSRFLPVHQTHISNMSDQVQEILDVPREFVKDGLQFMNRCQKRTVTSHTYMRRLEVNC